MTDPTAEARAKAAATYNAAADFYEHEALSFWDRFGRRTVERIRISPGDTVLDVCCGAGASAIPAVERVTPHGRVIAVDLAENLLKRARAKCRALGLRRIEFRCADMMSLHFSSAAFDAVICVFGIFFTPRMEEAVRELWRMVKPGGQLAITTWGPNLFEPANTIFWETVRKERSDLYKQFNPWDRINDPASVRELLRQGGVERCDVVAEPARHRLKSPEDWWAIILGSGYRATIEQLSQEPRERVKRANLRYVHENRVESIEANVIYAIAEKQGQAPRA